MLWFVYGKCKADVHRNPSPHEYLDVKIAVTGTEGILGKAKSLPALSPVTGCSRRGSESTA